MIKVKFNQPLPIVAKRVMTGLKILLLGIAGFRYFAEREDISTIILASCLGIDFLVDLFMGEDPIITLERAAQRINDEIPNSTIKYEIKTSLDGTETGVDESKDIDTCDNNVHSNSGTDSLH